VTRFISTCGMTTLSEPSATSSPESLCDPPRLRPDEGGPVFAEPWQAEAFALAVTLSEQGHFTWKEWAAALADELQAAARRGEPDDGSRYYEYWLTALERLVTAKGLANPAALFTRKAAWAEAYRTTPHGMPVELSHAPGTPGRCWLLLGLASTFAAYWMMQHSSVAGLQQVLGPWASLEGFDPRSVIAQVGLVGSAGLGSLLGMRHALEPDHLVAVSTLMTGERTSAQAAWLGACWGLGHTLTLLAAGATLVVLRTEMPPFAAEAFEFGVVLMLVGFAARAIYQGACRGATGPTHSHAKRRASLPVHVVKWTTARPFLVGAVHGLAGSGALTALVVAMLPSTVTRLSYLALFGIGSTLGMAALSGLLGWQIARVGTHRAVARAISVAVGCVSTALGLFWGYPLIGRLF
jgi:nitrile hydratase accessory protein